MLSASMIGGIAGKILLQKSRCLRYTADLAKLHPMPCGRRRPTDNADGCVKASRLPCARQHKAMDGHAAFSRMPALAIRCSRFPFHCSSSVFVTGKSMMHIHSLRLLSRLLYMDVTATITTITTITITATTGDMVLRDTRDFMIHRIMTYTFLET